jgi:2',3'-cyclic-nucleotide 2'-phosphodiesterase (5'-nucleotidase family)
MMGYDAVGVGDDDLTLGKEFLLEVAKRAHFPFLSSNILNEETGKLLFRPYLLKEVSGLRVGIFSLLSPDLFMGTSDLRRKGLAFQAPFEAAHHMVKELQPKADLIILLSHLGYQKDVELAQTVPGIHLIVGSHTGVHLSYPTLIKNTIILQMAPKGMYGGKLNLTFYNNEPTFYNTLGRQSLENNLNFLNLRLNSKDASEADKTQWQKSKEEIERSLNQFKGKNEFNNALFPLGEQIEGDPNIQKRVDEFKSKYSGMGDASSPK